MRCINAALQHDTRYGIYQQLEMKMQNILIDQWKSYPVMLSNAIKELGEIQKRGLEALSGHHIKAARRHFDTVPSHVKVLSEAKDYRALLAAQSAAVTAYGEDALAYVGQTQERIESWAAELRDWFGKYLKETYNISGIKAF